MKEIKEWFVKQKSKFIITAIFVVALFMIFPEGITRKADFRAKRQMKQYVSYYACEYSIYRYCDGYFFDGDGVIRIYRDKDGYWSDILYTDQGYIVLDEYVEEIDLDSSSFGFDINEDINIDVYIDEGPLDVNVYDFERTELCLEPETDNAYEQYCDFCSDPIPDGCEFEQDGKVICQKCVYKDYREIISDDAGKCTICGAFYYISDTSGLGLCWKCEKHNSTDCTNCGEQTIIRGDLYSGFTLCDSCLNVLFSYDDMKDILSETETRDYR